jgi:hypothetical protein
MVCCSREPHTKLRVFGSEVGGNISGHGRNAAEKDWFRVFFGMVGVNPAIIVLYIRGSERNHNRTSSSLSLLLEGKAACVRVSVVLPPSALAPLL